MGGRKIYDGSFPPQRSVRFGSQSGRAVSRVDKSCHLGIVSCKAALYQPPVKES